jgi:CheY-like chemotaxis protein
MSFVSRRILVVDDLRDTATSLAFLLEHMGHRVEFSTEPAKVPELAKTFRPQVAFLDIGMPLLDGWTLGKMLRSDPDLQGLRIYAITGYARQEDRQRSRDEGFAGHFTKPIAPRELEAIFALLDAEQPSHG